jgi:hypothetical protein
LPRGVLYQLVFAKFKEYLLIVHHSIGMSLEGVEIVVFAYIFVLLGDR